jgi:hypothetical protein
MSETVLKFMLDELQAVRLVCQSCKGIVELPVGDLAIRFASRAECPLCRHPFQSVPASGHSYLAAFAWAVEGLNTITSEVQLQFVLPHKP